MVAKQPEQSEIFERHCHRKQRTIFIPDRNPFETSHPECRGEDRWVQPVHCTVYRSVRGPDKSHGGVAI